MPPVKTYRRKPSRRQQVQRRSMTLRRFVLIAGILATGIVALWGYLYGSQLIEHSFCMFEHRMERLGFHLEDVIVEGRVRTDKGHILNLLELGRGKSLFGVSLKEAQKKLETIPWIKRAIVARRLPHTLYIEVVEKVPVAVWQHRDQMCLIDRDGDFIEAFDAFKHKNLFVVTGENAPQHVSELVSVLTHAPTMRSRVTGATYMRSGRWDVILDGKINVKLPEKAPESALSYLVTIQKKHPFVNEDILVVDMRIPGRIILRLTPEAVKKKKGMKHA